MALKPVAVEGDVSATAGTTLFSGAQSGTWTAGPIQLSSWSKLKVGGTATIWKAICLFSFSGLNGSGATVVGTSTVTLTADSTKLQGASNNVLRDGDSETDSYGNKLEARAPGKLRSA